MAIGFNEVPNGSLTPFFYVEIDNSGAFTGSNVIPWERLLIGQQLSTKSAPFEIVQIPDLAQAKSLYGNGAQLTHMVEAALAANPTQPLYCLPILDTSGTGSATTTIVVAGPATSDGAVYLMIGGRAVGAVEVASGDTADDIASAIAAAITANTDLAVTATALTSTVTVTAKNTGLAGNEIDIRANYYQGEETPAGVTLTIGTMTGGSANPSFTTLNLSGAIANRWFQAIAHPYNDTANLTYMETELADRWQADSMTGGIQYVGKNDSFSNLTAFGDGRNSPFTVVMGASGSPTTPWEFAAELAGIVAFYAAIDPARPFQTLGFSHAKAPAKKDENPWTENETLLQKGLATFTVSQDGTVRIQRVVTTYKTSPSGAADPSYRDANTIYTLQAIRYDWRVYMVNKYPRHKLASDGANFGPGQPVITPKVGRAEAINRFQVWEELGWVEGLDAFKEALIVERNSGDVNRLDFLLRPNLMNQFRIGATKIQFIL